MKCAALHACLLLIKDAAAALFYPMQITIGGRDLRRVGRSLVRAHTYAAAARSLYIYANPVEATKRYFFGTGSYPASISVRTPLGQRQIEVYSKDDMQTINEVFCRRDYFCAPQCTNIVDLGANIGISALFFLTHAPHCHCWLYEPVPRNVQRLRRNLKGFESRYTLTEAAVYTSGGTIQFRTEDTGRYGQVSKAPRPAADATLVTVPCRHIDEVVREASRSGTIDLAKIDIEGAEQEVIRALAPELRRHIREIVYETNSQLGALRVYPSRPDFDLCQIK